ncbi:MAG TPA: CYTH domain-containing protein [Thermoplasmata archaeon]|nr:CYTH domain-containing protein [Thermoplasmata archaeon]
MTYREVEAALLVRSDTTENVLRRISELPAFPMFHLGPAEKREIRDIYFDTPDRSLQKARLALRLRDADGEELVTLKWRTRRTDAGVVEREELEDPWSPKMWEEILKELRRRGGEVGHPHDLQERASARATIEWHGLEVVQERRNSRRARAMVRHHDEKGRVAAEMDIDSVTYRFSGGDVRIGEVEIEAAEDEEDSVGCVKSAADFLVAMFTPHLVWWRNGKLATGKAIEHLFAKKKRAEFLGKDGRLTPAGVDSLGEALATGEF